MRGRLTRLFAGSALVAITGSLAAPVAAQVVPDDTNSYGELITGGAEIGVFQPSGGNGGGGGGGGGSNRQITCELFLVTPDGEVPTTYAQLEALYAQSPAPITVTRMCTEAPATILPEVTFDWTPADGNPVDPQMLAELAMDRLFVPPPAGDTTPSLEVGTQAQMPTYFWIDNWPGEGALPSASASAGGVTVTATATPVSHTWVIDDSLRGSETVSCDGPGVEFSGVGDPPPGACAWTPTHSSAGQSTRHPTTGEPCFPAQVTVVWDVTWSGGDLGQLESAAAACIVVHEIQAVVSES
ncbi:MAG TPA: hypothetical protein VIL36_17405 [Acidimicrobiales bacterium]